MKKRILFPVALVSALVISGCVKENFNDVSEVKSGTVEFTAGIKTRTVLQSDEDVLWTNGDKINVNGHVSDALELESPSETATFKFTDATIIEGPYNAVFPASIYKNGNTVTLPAYQTYKAGTFAEAASPMAAYSETKDLVFHHLCAVIKLNVTLPDESAHDKIEYVDFHGNGDEQVSGDFTIDYTTATLAGSSDAEADRKIRYKVDKNFNDGKLEMYLVVPAREYAGYTVKVLDSQGHYMEVSKKSASKLAAGKLYDMPEFEFVPDKTELGVEIASAEDLIKFAQAYNGGEYADEDLLIATLTQDIDFDETTSAAFAATGGIGTDKGADGATNYFNGVFNGNGKAIKNYAANIPLFAYTGSAGVVKDLTIDETSSFTFDSSKLEYMGAVVGYHRGSVENVTVASDITIASAEVTSDKALGSICGRIVVGNVVNCTYTGNIVVPVGFSASGAIVDVGGIAGLISNVDGEISETYFKGTLNFAGLVQSTDRGTPYLRLGGVVGSNLGTVSDCEVTKEKTFSATNGSDSYTVTIANSTTKSYNTAEGGIVGFNDGGTIIGSVNRADIANFIRTTGTDGTHDDSNSRYAYIGGIVGINNGGEVSDCDNYGYIRSRSNPRIQQIGGIVGLNSGSVRKCVNESTARIIMQTSRSGSYGARLPVVGGVIGQNKSSDVSDVANKASIELARIENTASSDVRVGGVIGSTTASIDGAATRNISNSGAVTITNDASGKVTLGYFVAGVVGYAGADVKNVINTGSVTYIHKVADFGLQRLYLSGIVGIVSSNEDVEISGCKNEGKIALDASTASSEAVAYTNNNVGGILGSNVLYSTVDDQEVITISNLSMSSCENLGSISGGNTTTKNGNTLFMGGVAGRIKGTSSINGCSNSGEVQNTQANNSKTKDDSVYGGGIVGFVEGTAENVISVTDCHINTNAGATFGHRRGYVGGIAGYAEYAALADCTNDRNFNGSSWYIGGIVGWLVNATVNNCDWTGTSMSSSQFQNGGGGGIVAKLDTGCVIDGCDSYAKEMYDSDTAKDKTTPKFGLIAGQSVSGSIIRNCHYVSGLEVGICSDTNFTGENNSADLE